MKSNDKRTNSESNFDETQKSVVEIEFVDETSSFGANGAVDPRMIYSIPLFFADGSSVLDVREAGSGLLSRQDRRKRVTMQEKHDDVWREQAQRHGGVASRPNGPVSAKRQQHS